MAIELRISKKKQGTYYQAYESYYDNKKKQGRHKHIKTFGFDYTLKKQGIKDPLKYVQSKVDEMNKKFYDEKDRINAIKITDEIPTKNIGYFLIKSAIDKISNVDLVTDILASQRRFQFDLSKTIRELIYAQIIRPASKLKYSEEVMPSLYEHQDVSEDQIYEALDFIGSGYKKFIEMYNVEINKIYKRNYRNLYFDCTNYYFEIDCASEDKQKGPSKENRHDPIIGQALLLDSDCMPLAMEMYPGNESEKTYIRKLIEESKERYNITGKTIQVADKGLNCAKNIYLAKKNNDGYIFSKSVKGHYLSEIEKRWVTNDYGFKNVNDGKGKLKYKIKECVDFFDYQFVGEDGKIIKFKVKEKRVVSYNPSLAQKQKFEIEKQVEKVLRLNSIKACEKSDYGDSVKYVKFSSKDESGKKIKITPTLNIEKINEDKLFAGYNLIVTSEYNAKANEIYDVYHHLSKIEESFRITKNALKGRPVFVRTKEEIYGHFLITFLALQIIRLLELKFFNKKVNYNNIIEFVRGVTITKQSDGKYVNNLVTKNKGYQVIKNLIDVPKIDYLYLEEKDINKILKFKL